MILKRDSGLVQWISALLVGSCIWSSGTGVARAEEYRVASEQELQTVLAEIRGGEIVLAPGDYGDLRLERKRYPAQVTLRSELPREAVFDQILLKDSGNIGFEGLRTRKQFRAEGSDSLALSDCLANGMLYFRNVDRLQIQNCNVSGGQFGVLFNTVSNFEIRQSRVGKVSEDVMRITGDSHDGLVEDNVLDDVLAYPPTHPDLIQMFAAKGKTPHRITIRRNLLRDEHATGSPKRTAQGVFVSDPGPGGYREVLIEDNVINTRSANSIYINGGQNNVVVRNNTLLPGVGDGGAIIRIGVKSGMDNSGTVVEGNVAKLIVNKTQGAKIGRNYIYGRNANIAALFSGTGKRWQDFLPVIGTAIDRDNLGATPFLKQLLAAQKPGAIGGPRLGPDWSE